MGAHEEPVRPIERNSPAAKRLGSLADRSRADAQSFYDATKGNDPNEEGYKPTERTTLTADVLREMDRANDYSLDLATYWEQGRQSAADSYDYGADETPFGVEAPVDFRKGLDADLKPLEAELADRVKAFQDATSPTSDYEPGRIADAADKLQRTVAATREVLQSHAGKVGLNNRPEQRCLAALGATLTGVSERVAARLNDLAVGNVAERVTLDGQTTQMLERAKVDDLGSGLKDKEASLAKKQAELRAAAQKRDAEIARQKAAIATLNQLPKPLNAADTAKLTESEQHLDRMLSKNARDTLPKRLAAELNSVQTRRQNYQEALIGARGDLADRYRGKNVGDFYKSGKEQFLDEVEALADKKSRKALDDAFHDNFRKALDAWAGELSAKKLDAGRLKNAASDVLLRLDSYGRRATGIVAETMKNAPDESTRAELQCALDRAAARMQALRAHVAENLESLLKRGLFD